MRTRLLAPLRSLGGAQFGWGALALAVGATLEIVGRRVPNELWDVGLLLLVGLALGAVRLSGARTPAAWGRHIKGSVKAGWGRVLARYRIRVGIDLRGTPPIAVRPIPVFGAALRILVALVLVVVVSHVVGVGSLRQLLASWLYLVYVTLLAALWALLLGAVAVATLFLFAWVHDHFVRRHHRRPKTRRKLLRRPVGLEIAIVFAGMMLVVFLAEWLPAWVPVALAVLCWGVFMAVLWRPRGLRLDFLWQQHAGGPVHGIPWQRAASEDIAIGMCFYLVLALLSVGRAAIGLEPVDDSGMLVTGWLGRVFAWSGGFVAILGLPYVSWRVLRCQQRDPSRPCPTSVHVDGIEAGRAETLGLLQAEGWTVRFAPEVAQSDDVHITLAPAMPPLGDQGHGWPRVVSVRALGTPEVKAMIRRRDEVQRRRKLTGGFEGLFKSAARRSFDRGSGYWIGPHLWFMRGMARDDMEQDEFDFEEDTVLDEMVGKPYHKTFSGGARHHFHEIMQTLELDLVYVEDGLDFRRFRRVLRILFEHYDVQRRPISERHLVGVPGVRAVIHEFVMGNPYKKDGYPEPDYDEIGRARILHLFRDRGGEEEDLEAPVDAPGKPEPAPLLL